MSIYSVNGLFVMLMAASIFLTGCEQKSSQLNLQKNDTSIINGMEVQNGEFIAGSVVGIYNIKDRYICTGTLIAPNVVMTAAHCMGKHAYDLRIIFNNDIDDVMSAHEQDIQNQLTRVGSDFMVNPQWKLSDPEAMDNRGDIALVKFKGELPAGYYPANFLYDASLLKYGTLVTVAGFGVSLVETKSIDPRKYKNLDQAIEDGEVVCEDNDRKCMEVTMSGDGLLRQTKAPISAVLDTELRLDERKAGTCSGDSGGPAFLEVNGQLYVFGVTSRGSVLCDETGIYTNALTYMQWIQDTIKVLK